MSPVRLDPADPFASVLAWLAELARALGLDPAQRAPRTPPTREVAAAVRVVLADWSRQLRALVWAKALRLARGLAPDPRAQQSAAAPAARTSARGAGAPEGRRAGGRMVAVASPGRRPPRGGPLLGGPLLGAARQASLRPAWDEALDPADAAALKARTRAVFLALHDPGVLIRRLAHRLARAGVARREPSRFPHPPRTAGLAPRGLAIEPELRPPIFEFLGPRARPTCSTPRGSRGGAVGAGVLCARLCVLRVPSFSTRRTRRQHRGHGEGCACGGGALASPAGKRSASDEPVA